MRLFTDSKATGPLFFATGTRVIGDDGETEVVTQLFNDYTKAQKCACTFIHMHYRDVTADRVEEVKD